MATTNIADSIIPSSPSHKLSDYYSPTMISYFVRLLSVTGSFRIVTLFVTVDSGVTSSSRFI